jgi:hypothetical protein
VEDDERDWETVMDQSEDEKTQHHKYQEKYLDDSDDEVSCGGGMVVCGGVMCLKGSRAKFLCETLN